VQGGMRLEKSFKSYSNNQGLWCWKQIWFNRVDILHAIISKSKYCWWKDNNYTEKLVIERLSQITYDFSNIWQLAIHCAWSLNINQSIIELIIN